MGAATTLISAVTGLAGRLRALLGRSSSSSAAAHPFDREHGVDTSGLLYADKLPTGHAHDRYSEGYYATAPSVFRELVAQWQATLPPIGLKLEDYTLIDLGCGKGRVLMLASEYPFRAVMGVELNAKLARVGRRNLRRWMRGGRACRNVRVEHGDVLDLVLPAGPVVLFLFNAFAAEIVGKLMEKLAAAARLRAEVGSAESGAAPIDLLYVHPDQDAVVGQTPGIELLCYVEIAFSEEDAAADVFGVSSDVCSLWRWEKKQKSK